MTTIRIFDCYYCRNVFPQSALKKCGGCKSKWYCSPECQKADWPRHKKKCSEEKSGVSIRKVQKRLMTIFQGMRAVGKLFYEPGDKMAIEVNYETFFQTNEYRRIYGIDFDKTQKHCPDLYTYNDAGLNVLVKIVNGGETTYTFVSLMFR